MGPTTRGVILLLLAAPLMAASAWFPNLIWLGLGYALLCLILMAVDWRMAGSAVSRFDVQREHEPRLSIGADNSIRLMVRNRSRYPVSFQLRDEAPDAFIISERILKGEAGPHGVWNGQYTLHPLRRGDYRFGDLNLRWPGPLQLVIRQGKIPAAGPIKVYPNLLDVRRYDLLLRKNRLQEMGLRSVRMFGEGTEFERLREYQPDDEFRSIDWKATARRNRPVTTQYQVERSQTVMALVDIGRMMQSPVAQMAKLDYVINATLLLSYVVTGKGDKVGLLTFADEVAQFVAPREGRGQFYRCLETLYAVEPQPVEPDYGRAFNYLSVKQRKRSLVVIFTDLSGGMTMQSLVRHVSLLARRSLPLVVTINDPDVYAATQQHPDDSASAYQWSAAMRLLDERRIALDHLRRQGVLTLDVPANELSIAVINRYLELKARTQL